MTPTVLIDSTSFTASSPLGQQQSMTLPSTMLDTCIQLLYTDATKGIKDSEFLYAHRSVLSKSPYFRAQLQQSTSTTTSPIVTISVDLSTIKNPIESFKALLVFMYTGQLTANEAVRESLIPLSKLCELPALEQQLVNSSADTSLMDLQRVASLITVPVHPSGNSSPLVSISPPSSTMSNANIATQLLPQINPAVYAAYFQLLQQQQLQQKQEQLQQQALFNNLLQASIASRFAGSPGQVNGGAPSNFLASTPSIFPKFEPTTIPIEGFLPDIRTSESERSETRSVTSSCSSANQATIPSPPFNENAGDVLVPSNEKEGWCRNKKYIQTVPKGYRCTVCNKVYGRYNSVSYHVTIYHRNPPIRCEEPGCQFTTREARYIHFHRYYRHQIPLPETIDLASRKCPFFSCRHVSKSPAMLDKHINRHVADCTKDGQTFSCPNCEYSTQIHQDMFLHLRAHQLGVDCGDESLKKAAAPGPSHNVFACDQCSYSGRTLKNLEHHKQTKHSSPFTPIASALSPTNRSKALTDEATLTSAQLSLVETLKSLPAFSNFQLFPALSTAATTD
ncbi:Zinc finger protein [Aphelenchoides besseyi]|nr:Zinc finger protein [Aphelenchoides besseyi]